MEHDCRVWTAREVYPLAKAYRLQKEGARPGAHAYFISPRDWYDVLDALESPADLMLEAKEKDRALFALRRLAGEAERPIQPSSG